MEKRNTFEDSGAHTERMRLHHEEAAEEKSIAQAWINAPNAGNVYC